jgi:hypothetical protein
MPWSRGSPLTVRTPRLEVRGDLRPELDDPAPDRLVANVDAALGKHFLDIS